MTDQPDELSEARAEVEQEDLSVVDDDSLTANTTTDNERVDDETSGPPTEQPGATE
ncbi:hypothetical protein [Kocuria rosea]|uniref:hypothetical protein n=1 Tax=Kocuria rosea TaxID=1275 RepID=UPI00203CBD3F|nr:hypothetical protein [Kocuria rosea]MCM3688419.1 hypothetical protein [Kocuria rosea]